MQLLYLQIFLSFLTFVSCMSGVFDNVTVLVKVEKNTVDDVILIDFDDNLKKHLNNRTEIVLIKNQFIPILDTNSITDIPRLRSLTLTKSGIREIRRGAFSNLPNLKMLNLSSNNIEEIHNGIFNHLPLEELYLDNNKIFKIGYKAFVNLSLRRLFLNYNKISRWSKDWFADSSVNYLDMSFNLIEYLPPKSFHLMTGPARGNFSVIFTGNQLRRVNNNIFNGFEYYQHIFLDSNLIAHLDVDAFDGVKHINTLNLNNNSILNINSQVFRNVDIDVLMLEDNKLRCLSTDIFKMEELDIDGNPITCFCVKTWIDWRGIHSNPSIYHITNLEQDCI